VSYNLIIFYELALFHIPRAAAAAAAATRLLENPVEATTVVQNFVLLLVENVV
jgi:hypothetical protein